MATQPNTLGQYIYIGTVGSVLVTDRPASVYSVVQLGTYVGTVMLYDASTAAGTLATNVIGTIGLPATSTPGQVEFNLRTRNGLVYTSTGTPNVTLVWD